MLSKSMRSTLMHTAELLVVFAIVIAFLYTVGFNPDLVQAGGTLLLAACAKYLRVEPSIPVKDYVNEDAEKDA